MKKNLRVRQVSALARRKKEMYHWERVANPVPVTKNMTEDQHNDHRNFEQFRTLKMRKAATDITNLQAKIS